MEAKSDEKAFIEGVWRKVRYLEYQKREEALLKKLQCDYRKKRLKSAICILPVIAAATISTLSITGVGMFSLIVLGSLYMAAGVCYEYIPDLNYRRRQQHEYTN